jgi:flavodoxin
MKYTVVYFTRSGRSQRVAEEIAQALNCGLVQITDNMDWSGFRGFFRAGRYSGQNLSVEIQVHGDLSATNEYIVVAPLWAGGVAPAIRKFLKTIPNDKVHLVVTSIGSKLRDRDGYKSLHDIQGIILNAARVINGLVDKLKSS